MKFSAKIIIAILAITLISNFPVNAGTKYVTISGAGDGSGSSWTNAINATSFPTMLAAGVSGDQFWVAVGTYKPTNSTDRTKTFTIPSAVKVYGGFVGTETLLSQRNIKANQTILSGDIGTIALTDNSYLIITIGDATIATQLDGFTVLHGYNNQTGSRGGSALYTYLSNPIIANCTFFENVSFSTTSGSFTTGGDGGAIYILGTTGTDAAPSFNNCFFYSNSANGGSNGGGAIRAESASTSFSNCVFWGNSSSTGNGGALNLTDGVQVISNCTFYNNTMLVNVAKGAAVYINTSNASASILINNIFYTNTYGGLTTNNTKAGSDLYFDGIGYTQTVTNSITQAFGTSGVNGNKVGVDPQFLNINNLSGIDAIWGTDDDGLNIQNTSPAIDAGIASGAPASDVIGTLRPKGAGYDIGAYEFVTTPPPTITSFSPAVAKPGDLVTINGANYNVTPTNNIVFFGAVKAMVTASTTTSLTVTVPYGSTFAPITVLNTTTSLAASSMQNFRPIYSPAKTGVNAIDFSPKRNFTIGTTASYAGIADLDADGKPDLIFTNVGGTTISVLRNTSTTGSIGSSSFSAVQNFIVGTNPQSVAIADIDGDGKLDLAIANANTANVSILRNTSTIGTISFSTKQDYASGTSPYSLTMGDFDGDGKPDLAVAVQIGSTISLFRNISTIGNIVFAAKQNFASGSFPQAISSGDLDGDGKLDLATANYIGNNVSVLRNISTIGAINFSAKQDFATGINPYSMAIGDLDGDGKPELAIANISSNTVSILRNMSTIGIIAYLAKQDITSVAQPISATIGDVDGDGLQDLTITSNSSAAISIFRNISTVGAITFAASQDLTNFVGGYFVAIGDLDADGKPDLVVANSSVFTASIFRNADIPIPPPTIISFTPLSAKPGDIVTITGTNFNSTPTNNIVYFGATKAIVNVATVNSLTVVVPKSATYGSITALNIVSGLACYSNSHFNPIYSPAKTGFTLNDFQPKVDFTTGTTPEFVAMNDLDGDGKPDMIVANAGTNNMSVFRNTSTSGLVNTGTFAAKVDIAVGFRPYGIAVGDIDADGLPDLAVITYGTGSISVFRNKSTVGNISFDAKVDFVIGVNANPYTIVMKDLDGDGKPDLCAYGLSAVVSIFLNKASSGSITSASFASKLDINLGTGIVNIAISDIDGDGKPDFIGPNYTTSAASICRNTSTIGNVSFATKVDFASGNQPLFVTIGDIDADGKPDVVVANSTLPNVSVLHNTSVSGTVNFDSKVNFSTGSVVNPVLPGQYNWHLIALGDFDGDSKPDIAVINNNTTNVSILRNTGSVGSITSTSFATKVDFTTGNNPVSLAVGDIDGDHKSDLLIANATSNRISVLRNADIVLSATITTVATLSALNTTYGTASSNTSFSISGANMTAGITVTAPNGFEVSTTAGSGFANSITVGAAGTIASTTIYARLAASTNAGNYSGNIALTSSGATTVNVATVSNTVTQKSLTITATNVNKTFGATITGATGSTAYTSVGLVGTETIGSVTIAYGTGAAASATSGTYAGSVTASAAAGGTFSAGNYNISYVAGDIIVSAPPTIIAVTNLSALNTTYGTASNNTSFSVSGTNMTAGITVTAPTGFEVSTTAGSGFANSITVGAAGTISSATIYVRLVATNNAGNYSGNIILTSSGAATVNIATVSSTVTQKSLTITATNVNKTYGATITGATGSTAYTSVGLVGTETIGTVSIAYGTGSAATSAVGTYAGSVTPSAATGGTFIASNYSITYATGDIIVDQQNLTITASNANRTYGSTLTGAAGSTAFTSVGLLNGETIGTVTIAYTAGSGNGNAAADPIGTYTGKVTPSAATGGTFTPGNYNITYNTGNLIVGQKTLTITATNVNKTFGATITGATGSTAYTSVGLVGTETIGSVTIAYGTGAAASATSGTYAGSVTASAAAGGTFSAGNYNISYVAGDIIVSAPPTIIAVTNLSALNTTYGTASNNTSFSVSGTNMTAGITVTAPTGFEVSTTAGSGFANSITVGAAGTISSATIYVRLVATNNAGNYSGNIILTSSGAATVNIATVSSTVTQKSLTITATNVNKTYGATITGATGSTAYTSVGLVGTETIGTVSIAYGTGSAATSAVGTYAGSVTPSAATGGTFNQSNYSMIYTSGNIIVGTAALMITANNQIKCEGVLFNIPVNAYQVNGLLTSDAVTSISLSSVGSSTNATAGSYPINSSSAIGIGLSNYSITYANGFFTVNAVPIVAAIIGTQQVCVQSSTTFSNTTTGGIWSSGTTTIATINSNGIITGIKAGISTISFTVSNASGCITFVTRDVTVNALPTVTVSASPTNVSKGLTTQLNAVGSAGTTYQWTPAGNLSDATIANPIARVTDNTTYIVTVTNAQGCTQSSSVNVTVTEDMYIEPVIVFTPNGDGINDKFVIKNLDQYPVNHLQVFDRTGKVVYETNNYSNNWDGTVNGKLLVKDSYFYILTIKGAVIKRGTITLVR